MPIRDLVPAADAEERTLTFASKKGPVRGRDKELTELTLTVGIPPPPPPPPVLNGHVSSFPPY